MDTQILKTVGVFAGLGGVSLGVLLIVFRAVIQKNIFPSMTKEQSYKTINRVILLTFGIAVIGIIAWTTVEVVPHFAKAAPGSPKETTLALSPLRNGIQTFNGSVHDFALSNPLAGLAVIESIEVEIIDVVEDKWATTQALFDTFKYKVELDPTFRGRKKFAEGFKYAPGEVDRLSVLFTSKGGFDYFLRFIVTWHDTLANQKKSTISDIQIARFPSVENTPGFDRNEIGRRSEEHGEFLKRRMEELRKSVK